MTGPEQVRRELIAQHWRGGMPTSEIARELGIDEGEICRVVEEIEGDGNVRDDTP